MDSRIVEQEVLLDYHEQGPPHGSPVIVDFVALCTGSR
jgi:hypothetical protein